MLEQGMKRGKVMHFETNKNNTAYQITGCRERRKRVLRVGFNVLKFGGLKKELFI